MNKFIFRVLVLLIINLALGYKAFSQIEDFQIWNEFAFDKSLNKKTSLLMGQQLRLSNNASRVEDYITVLGAQYEINKYVKLGGSYRFTHSKTIENEVINENRFMADVLLKYKANRFTFGNRVRYQMDYVDFEINRYHTLRNKLSVKYNIAKSPFTPYAEWELFYSLNSPAFNTIYANRYTLGTDYEISKTISVSAYYRLQTTRAYLKKPRNTYILGLGASFSF